MGKKISAKELRTQLSSVLDQLDQGQSHFVIERNNREIAVLLSMEKFLEIMQMLELLNTLDFIDPNGLELGEPIPADFPDLVLLRPANEALPEPQTPEAPRPRNRDGASIEDMAAKLGIRIIK
jgi:prevent-host-death family protein